MRSIKSYSFFLSLFFSVNVFAQNETAKWYFGNRAALDFMTSPPTSLNNSVMQAQMSTASIADAAGNLLFYTRGDTVYNATHTVMANGAGLAPPGPYNTIVLIIPNPANNNSYYIITSANTNFANTIYYAFVDMSLAAGLGSVTVKQATFTTIIPFSKLAVTKHCNGTDYWIVTHGLSSNNFTSHLLTGTGISTTAVVSSVGAVYSTSGANFSQMKISPNGKKLATALPNFINQPNLFELCDFDASTGIVSNPVTLLSNSNLSACGCEFSPDGSKLYGTRAINNFNYILQWDLCAGSNTAIAASLYSVVITPTVSGGRYFIQLAKDGKIYVDKATSILGVIQNPNLAGAACNYTDAGVSIAPRTSNGALLHFPSYYFVQKPALSPFTFTNTTCQTTSFTSPPAPFTNTLLNGCSAVSFSLLGTLWEFGDIASGSANTSTLTNPQHFYTNVGTYTAKLIYYYSCGGGTDTLKQVINITQPCITINSTSITCANLGSATVTALPNSGVVTYTWLPVGQTGSVATGLIPGTYTLLAFVNNFSVTHTYTTTFLPLIPLTGSISASQSIACNAANTGTGSVSNLAGGSGNQNYLWGNGSNTFTNANPNNLSAGTWSVTVTDALTACQVYSVFTITQPPALTLNIAANSPTACAGTSIVLTGTNSGGTPGYTYTWTTGPSVNTKTVSQISSGAYVYTLISRDANLCLTTKTISASFVPNPTPTVSSVFICPSETGTLSASGASTYTWLASTPLSVTATSYTDSPVATQQYSVLGSALGCTAATSASIIVKPIPSPTLSNNGPICNGQNIQLNSAGGVSYLWSGPNSYTSIIQNPTISPALPIQSGVYNLTVTAANSCTASASTTVVVNPTPTIALSGGPVCFNSNLVLSASSFTGSSYLWNGPNSFSSSLQNPTITAATFSAAGTYSLLVTSITSCSNTATVSVIVNSLPTISIVPSSTVICFGKSTNLFASGGNTYLWNTTSTSTNVTVSPTVNTTYTVMGYSAAGCTNSAVQSISVNALPTLSVVLSPSVYCTGGSSTLTASGANTYTWSNNISGTVISVSPVFTSFYNVKGTDAITGCSNTAFATVSVNPLPVITASASQSVICTGISATLITGGGNTYTWAPLNLNTTTIFPVPLVTTIYTVTGTNSLTGCQNTAIKTISVNITPTVYLVSNTPSLCAGRSAIFTPSGALTYTLNPGNFTGTNFTVTPAGITQYSLSGTNSVNCINLQPSNLSIIVYSLTPISGVVTSTTGLNNGNVVLYKYKPSLGKWDSLATSLIITSNYNFPSVVTGTYVVKAFPFPTDIIETYGLSSSSWQGAAIINHDCINASTQNIDLITIDNTIKSKASLSGKISLGVGYSVPGSPGAPIPNIIVKAGVHTGTTIVQRTRTNAQGNYTLANLMPNAPGKDYYILVDIPGLDTNTTYHRIIITGLENFTNLDFVVDSQRIRPTHLTVGVKELNTAHANIKVFPNPASDKISIEFELKQAAAMSIDLSDLSGRKIKEILSESKQNAGALTVLTGVSDLKEGMYLLNIKIGNEERVLKLVVGR